MAFNIQFDSNNQPIQPTLVLAKRDGTKIGILPSHNFNAECNFNSFSNLSFTVYKTNNGASLSFWNNIKDFKLLWAKEWDLWFEIYVESNDSNGIYKNVTAKSLGEAELSQSKVHKLEINTETDILREDYSPTVFYNSLNQSCSLLNRILYNTPHYSIRNVATSLHNIQRCFSFDGDSVYDAFMDISDEIKCYFDFSVHSDANGNPDRRFSVYDLEDYCSVCGSRGDFTSVCSECRSPNIVKGFGIDTGIFVSTKNLSDEISYQTNAESVKNCFRLEAGDDLMTATIKSCNPNGSQYIWNISDEMKSDMPRELVTKLNQYDTLYADYQNTNVLSPSQSLLTGYNTLVSRYISYKSDLVQLPVNIVGFLALMNACFGTIDFNLFLNHGLMPSTETNETTAVEQASKLTYVRLSPVAVQNISIISASTVDSYVLAMARSIINRNYQVRISSSSYNSEAKIWSGIFNVTNYYNDSDTSNSASVSINISENFEKYVSQLLDKSLVQDNSSETDITALFALSGTSFANALKQYSLAGLKSFYDCCDACLNVLIEQGAATGSTIWENETDDLYVDLYQPYLQKKTAIANEISQRESEIEIINNAYNWILEKVSEIQSALNFENYLGTSLWHTFISYKREDTYSNSNYISDGLSNTELFENARQFLKVANKELYKSSHYQHSISSTLNNLLAMKEFKGLLQNFYPGNYIHIECDGAIYKLRLLSYDINYSDLSKISVTFADVEQTENGYSDIQDVIENAKSLASSYNGVAHQAEKGKNSRSQLDDWTTNGLSLTALKIINNADNQDYVFDSHGMVFRKYIPITDTYDDEQLKIINSTIAITNDSWNSVKTAIGSFYFKDPISDELTHGYGINGEVVMGKLILGEQLGIYNSGASLRFNHTGLSITNGEYTFRVSPSETNLVEISKPPLLEEDNPIILFKFANNGDLYIKGQIEATSGIIGGCSIVDGVLKIRDANIAGTLSADKISGGTIDATNVTITNLSVSAANITSGTINSARIPNLSADKITSGTISTNRLDVSDIVSTGNITTKNGTFAGTLLAATGSFSGSITANSGYIGGTSGWVINSGYIGSSKTGGSFYIASAGDSSNYWIRAHNSANGAGTRTFSVSKTGELYATGATISGNITSDNAIITGGSISFGESYENAFLTINGLGIKQGVDTINSQFGWGGLSFGWCQWSDLDHKNKSHFGSTPDTWGSGNNLYGIQTYLDPMDTSEWSIGVHNGIYDVGYAGITFYMASQYANCYAKLIGTWQISSGAAITSDRNLKNSIENLPNNYDSVFDKLRAVRFKYNSGTSGRYHTGFIAQEVETAIIDSGLTTQDAALFVKFINSSNSENESITYALRYEEFISLNTNQIQKLKPRVATLEETVASQAQEILLLRQEIEILKGE